MAPSAQQRDADDRRGGHPELGKSIWVCQVQDPEQGPQFFVTLLPPEESFARGIIPEAIVGLLKKPLEEGEAIGPEDFVRHKIFNDFMHEFIARRGPTLEGLRAEARRQGEGWVYLIDGRTATPEGKVPPEDIIGAFEVRSGQLVDDSYRRNSNHVLLSRDGFFRLPPELRGELLRELTDRNANPSKWGDDIRE